MLKSDAQKLSGPVAIWISSNIFGFYSVTVIAIAL